MFMWMRGNPLFVRSQRVSQNDDAVEMVRHHDESVHIDKRILLGQATPGIVKHASGIVQMHLAISNFTE